MVDDINLNDMIPFYIYKNTGTRYPNEYYSNDDYIIIKLYSKKYGYKNMIIDKDDFDKVSMCNWKLRKDSKTFYALNSNYGFIHRIIMNLNSNDNRQVDHINGNGLDNRKNNLRIVTEYENSRSKHNSHSNTGILRICLDENEYPRYRVVYNDDNGKTKTKSFSINKYGKDKALELAKEFELKIRKLYYCYVDNNNGTK